MTTDTGPPAGNAPPTRTRKDEPMGKTSKSAWRHTVQPITNDPESLRIGRLANNYIAVSSLQKALNRAVTDRTALIGSIAGILKRDCWREWICPDDTEVIWTAADFRQFIEAPHGGVARRRSMSSASWSGGPTSRRRSRGRSGGRGVAFSMTNGMAKGDSPTTVTK